MKITCTDGTTFSTLTTIGDRDVFGYVYKNGVLVNSYALGFYSLGTDKVRRMVRRMVRLECKARAENHQFVN